MSRRSFIAAFVSWHLLAITIGSIPPPERFQNVPVREHPSPAGAIVEQGTALFDGFAAAIAPIPRALWWVTQPLHGVATTYRKLAGVGQSWAMFSNPPQRDQYVRTRYYVRGPNERLWLASELIFPAHHEDEVRLLQSYRDSYFDKAVAIAEADFYRKRRPALVQPDTRSDQLPDDLAPILRYFARRFETRRLAGTGQRVVRTELWIGNAPTASLGREQNQASLAERMSIVRDYYDGPVEERIMVPPFPAYHAGEREADILWVLEYFEEPREHAG